MEGYRQFYNKHSQSLHPKPQLAFYIPVNPDVYPSSINVPKHFAVILYGKLEYSFKQKICEK